MRFYNLTITDTSTGKIVKQWQSHPNGQFDPGALLIEFDAIVTSFNTPIEGQGITIHGVSLSDINQAQDFTGLQLSLYGGMKAGLPLANPNQSGLLMEGLIFQSWGTWEGTEMKLDFILRPDPFYIDQPGNLVLNWHANEPLSNALTNMLKIAYGAQVPPMPIVMNIAPLTQPFNDCKISSSLTDFRPWLAQVTAKLGHQVNITIQGGKIIVGDDTYKPTPIQIVFSDLIGQPAWIDPNVMQIKVILRADIVLGDKILMPKGLQSAPGQVLTMGQSMPSNEKYKSAFQGVFRVTQMRHLGNYKSQEGAAWATIINCTPEQPNG